MTTKKARPAQSARKSGVTPPPRLTSGIIDPPVGKLRCKAFTPRGTRCQRPPMHGKKTCMFHTGNIAAELGAKGGRRRAIYNPENLEPFAAPKSAGDLMLLLAQTIVEVRSGRLDPRVANSIAYLATGLGNALELADYERRLDALEIHPKTGVSVLR